jgi:hypothetical protein
LQNAPFLRLPAESQVRSDSPAAASMRWRMASSEVFAAELSRSGGTFHRSLAMGAKLLSTTAGARQGIPRGGARVGLQMDSHVFRCWKRSGRYDENRYLAALAKRNSPLAVVAGGTILRNLCRYPVNTVMKGDKNCGQTYLDIC